MTVGQEVSNTIVIDMSEAKIIAVPEALFSDSSLGTYSVSADTLRRLEKFYHWTQMMPKTLLADRVNLGKMVKHCMEPLEGKTANRGTAEK